MNRSFALLLPAFACAVHLARADAPPAPPFVRVPPPGSSWEVKIENIQKPEEKKREAEGLADAAQKADKKPPLVPVSLALKSGRSGVTEGVISYSDKHQEFFYVADGSIFQQATNSKNVIILSAKASERDPLSLRVASFPGLGWLAKEYFVGTKKTDTGDLLHFSRTLTIKDNPQPGPAMEAWIRSTDRQPVEARVENWIFRFGEVTPFEGTVSLPESFQTALAHERAQRNALEAIRQINSGERRP